MLLAGEHGLGAEVAGTVQRGGEVALAGRLLAGKAARPGAAAALDLGVGAVALGVAFADGVLLRVLGADAQAQSAVRAHSDAVARHLLLHHLARLGRQVFHLLAHLRHLGSHVRLARHAHVVLELPQAGGDVLGLGCCGEAGGGDDGDGKGCGLHGRLSLSVVVFIDCRAQYARAIGCRRARWSACPLPPGPSRGGAQSAG